MLSLNAGQQYFLYQSPCDMRKSFDGLCGLVHSELKREATSGEVFVFLNRHRTHLKLLHWGAEALFYTTNAWKKAPLPCLKSSN
jgi:transposase